jgi:hypothetical protein
MRSVEGISAVHGGEEVNSHPHTSGASAPLSPMTPSFWTTLSAYASELAPVAGPLLTAVSETASAIDRAGNQSQTLTIRADRLERELLPPARPAAKPRTRSKRKRSASVPG